MGFQPRARSRRFGRPVAKKKPARDRHDELGTSMLFVENDQIDASQVCSVTLNALEHLGNQRFALPPFSEHFQRWMENIATILFEFETELPEVVNQQYRENIDRTITNLRGALKERTDTEATISNRQSDVQRRIAKYETELAKLDQDYKTRNHEARRHHEQSFEKLRAEINTLDEERLRILHTKPSLLKKLVRRSKDNLEEKTNALRSKKHALDDCKQLLKQDLETSRLKYENERKQINEKLRAQQAQLEDPNDSKLDDALEIRQTACEELRRQIIEAVDKLPKQQDPGMTEGET
jgi:DNA repair exonuclease SbcCD ATPase subunit